MAKKKSRKSKVQPPLDADAIARAVTQQLPGFRVKPRADKRRMRADEDATAGIAPGLSLDALRQKFLGTADADAAGAMAADQLLRPSERAHTVMVEPVDGGPAKTADITPDGRVKVVQG